MVMGDTHDAYPSKPELPEEGDCCGSGCNPCIFDVHEANLKKWEEMCREIRENPPATKRGKREREFYLSETRYKPFAVKSIEPHTYNTKIFTLEATSLAASVTAVGDQGGNAKKTESGEIEMVREELGLSAGQHLIAKGMSVGGSNISRAYTPIEVRPGEFDILVKLYTDGRMSKYFAGLKVGDVAHFRGPYGGFTYRPNAYRRVLMLCAGTGLAPMFSVASAIVNDEEDETFVRLLFAVRTMDDILLRSELRALAENWNFTAQIHVSKSEDSNREGVVRYGENVRFARLDKGTLGTELTTLDSVLVLICGTETFNVDMTEFVLALGVQKTNIYVF